MEFSRQKYWIGLPFLSPGDLPNPGIKPVSRALQADSLPSEPLGPSTNGGNYPCSRWILKEHIQGLTLRFQRDKALSGDSDGSEGQPPMGIWRQMFKEKIFLVVFTSLFQVVLEVKNLPASAGDLRDKALIPRSGRSPGKENGSHSNILAWRIPWTEEPGGLQSIGLQRPGHDWNGLACTPASGCWDLGRRTHSAK